MRATPLPHLTASLASGISLFMLFNAAESWNRGLNPLAFIYCLFAVASANAAWISLADGYKRYMEFRRLKHLLLRHGCRSMIFRAGSSSRCQRDAAMAAAKETGYRAQAEHYYRSRGYRWYHLLPDGAAEDPCFLISPRFIKATLMPRKRPSRRKCRST